MSYDSRIILGAQQFDLAGAMNAGLEMAARQKQFDQQNALANLYKTQGANILAGDQNALNALAGFDPQAALGIQSQRQSMAYATEDQEFDRAAAQREAERYAKEVGAEKAAADAAELRANTMQALAAPTPEAFDALMIANGQPDMVGQWENRQLLAIPYLELADAIDMIAPKVVDPTEGAPSGYMFTDPNNRGAGVAPLPGYVPKAPVEINMGEDAGEYLYGADAGVPAGWRVHKGTGVASPIPGGPAAVEAQGVADAEAQAASNANIASDTVVTATKRALEASGEQMFGAPGTSLVASLPVVGPASPSGEKLRQTEVLKAQAIVSNLQAMRDASPTGGALGAVTKPELDMLAAKSGALDPNSPNFERDLLDYTRTLLRVVHGQAAGDAIFAQEFGDVAPPAPARGSATATPQRLRYNPETGEFE